MGSQDLQQARYDQLVRRVGALYGGGSKVVEVLPEVFPVLELEDTTPELLALSGWRMAWQSTERLSAVGNNSSSQIFNPAASGQIVAVTQVTLRTDKATNVQMELTTTQTGAPISGLFRDSRFGVPRSTVAQVSTIDGGAIGGGARIFMPIDVNFVLRDDNGVVILTPGTGLDVGTVNTQIRLLVNYFWRERQAQESELNFP